MNIYNNKNILITGNTGFKGNWLTLYLKSLGANIIGYSDKIPYNKSILSRDWLANNIKQYWGKVEDFSYLNESIKKNTPDIVFHLAAQPLVSASYTDPYNTFITNSFGTLNLLEAVRINRPNTPLVIVTTDKVYKNEEKGKVFKEGDELKGKDPYSSSKSCAEQIAYAYASLKKPMKIATVRAGNIIGGGDWSKDRIIPDLVESIEKGFSPQLRNPNATRPWLYVMDACSGYLSIGKKLLERNNLSFPISYNFSSSFKDEISVLELSKIFLKEFSKDNISINQSFSIGSESNILRLDSAKAKEDLNWSPAINIKDSILITAKWYKEVLRGKEQLLITNKLIKQYLDQKNKNNITSYNNMNKAV